MSISTKTRGQKRHLVSLYRLGPEVSDGDGGYTRERIPLDPPRMMAAIVPATARDLERVVANTVQSKASHVVTIDYHPGVNTDCEVVFAVPGRTSRRFAVAGVQTPDERDRESLLACLEVVT